MESPIDYEQIRINSLTYNNSFIMNSLLRCGVGFPTIFSLLWGDTIATHKCFPNRLREIVSEIVQEEKKKIESNDSSDKQLHSIIIDLLYLFYEREVNSIWEKSMKDIVK